MTSSKYLSKKLDISLTNVSDTNALVYNGISEAWDFKKRGTIKVLHKCFLVDCGGHEHDLQGMMSREKLFYFE